MAITYEQIAWQSLSTSAATVTFSSIASTWTDLRLVITPISTGASDYNLFVKPNSIASYYHYAMYGTGSTIGQVYTSETVGMNLISGTGFRNTPTVWTMDLYDYASARYKYATTFGTSRNNTNGYVTRHAYGINSTAAITSLTISTDAGNNFATGSTFALYGIKAA